MLLNSASVEEQEMKMPLQCCGRRGAAGLAGGRRVEAQQEQRNERSGVERFRQRRQRHRLPEEELRELQRGVRKVLLNDNEYEDVGEGEESSLLGFVLHGAQTSPSDSTSSATTLAAEVESHGRPSLESVAFASADELTWVQRRVKHIMRNNTLHARLYGDEGEVLELVEWMNRFAAPELGGQFIVGAHALSSVYSELERESVGEFNSTESKHSVLEVDPVKRAICRLALEVEQKEEKTFLSGVDVEERDARLRTIGLAKAAICAGMSRDEMQTTLGLDMAIVDDLLAVNPFSEAGQQLHQQSEDIISAIPEPESGTSAAGDARSSIISSNSLRTGQNATNVPLSPFAPSTDEDDPSGAVSSPIFGLDESSESSSDAGASKRASGQGRKR